MPIIGCIILPYLSQIPRLVTFSGRTEEGVANTLQILEKKKANVALQALLQESANTSPQSHPYRGYRVVNTDNAMTDVQVSVNKC